MFRRHSCEPTGGVLRVVNMDGAHRRIAHGDAVRVPGAEAIEDGPEQPGR